MTDIYQRVLIFVIENLLLKKYYLSLLGTEMTIDLLFIDTTFTIKRRFLLSNNHNKREHYVYSIIDDY